MSSPARGLIVAAFAVMAVLFCIIFVIKPHCLRPIAKRLGYKYYGMFPVKRWHAEEKDRLADKNNDIYKPAENNNDII